LVITKLTINTFGDFHLMKHSSRHLDLFTSLGLAVSVFLTTFAFAADKGVAYISNQNGKITVIDLDTMQKKGELNVGAKGPRGLGITADGKWLITANKDDSNISIVDTSGTNPPKLVNVGKNPEFVRVLGDRAYVTYEPSSKGGPPSKLEKKAEDDDDEEQIPGHIAIIDIKQAKVVKDIVGKPETEGLEFSKDGKKMIVTNESDNSITVHDIKSGKLIKSISVGKYGERPRGIKVSPDGKTYLVTLELSDKMLVLNDKFKVTNEVVTGKTPYGVSYDSAGQRIFVAANNENTLQVFDAKTHTKIKDIPTGKRCWHFSFTPDDQQLLLACGKSNEVIVINTSTLEATKRLPANEMPWGIVTYPKSMGSVDTPK
jgi:YVTN family beta-propeller protein